MRLTIPGCRPSISSSNRYAKRPERGVLRIWRREMGADAARVRRIRPERIRTAEWLAPERSGGVGCMDAPNNPRPPANYQFVKQIRKEPRWGFFVSGGESGQEIPRGFDGFARSESGQPNGWPRSAAEGLGAWMHPTIPGRRPTISLSSRYAKRVEKGGVLWGLDCGLIKRTIDTKDVLRANECAVGRRPMYCDLRRFCYLGIGPASIS